MRLELTISDKLYTEAKRNAAASGFGSVDEYVANLIQHDAETEDDFELVLTPEMTAQIQEGLKDVREGRTYPSKEVREHLAEYRTAWLEKRLS